MDSIVKAVSGVTDAASHVIYGDKKGTSDTTEKQSGSEPVSGVTGPGKPSEPYDGGNAEGEDLAVGRRYARDFPWLTTEAENQSSRGLSGNEDRKEDSTSGSTDPHTSSLTERRLDPGPVETGRNASFDEPSGQSDEGNRGRDSGLGSVDNGPTTSSDYPSDQPSTGERRLDSGLDAGEPGPTTGSTYSAGQGSADNKPKGADLETGDTTGPTYPLGQGSEEDKPRGSSLETKDTTGSTYPLGQGSEESKPTGSGLGTGNTIGSGYSLGQDSAENKPMGSGLDAGDTTDSTYSLGQGSGGNRLLGSDLEPGDTTGSGYPLGQGSTENKSMGSGLETGGTTGSAYPLGQGTAESGRMDSGLDLGDTTGTGYSTGQGIAEGGRMESGLETGDTTSSTYSSGQPFVGDTDTLGSSGAAGYATYTASKSDPNSDAPGGDSTTLGSGTSYTAVDQPDTSSTSYNTSAPRIISEDRGDEYDRPESTMRGDTSSQRLHGQYDTETAPSGGIAQGGQPQGINIVGTVRPEHDHDKTGVTSFHSTDPKSEAPYPSSSQDPSIPAGGQTRAPIGGFGVVEPSVGGDPSSGQTAFEGHHGAERPHEAPGDDGLQAIREKKEAAESTLLGGGGGGGGDDDGLEEYPRDRMDQHRPSMPGDPLGIIRERGTGVKQVKSTGLAADGGDFDAAAPGAGREADRMFDR